MLKSFRFFVLASALSFIVVPGVLAEQLGCNPHPQAVTTGTLQIIAYTVTSLLGL
jgi:hypothetical protein